MGRWVFLLLTLLALPAHAHKPSDSYLGITSDGGAYRAQWDIALRDLELAVGLDMNRDGEITWAELRQRQVAVAAYALGHLRIETAAGACAPEVTDTLVEHHSDGAYAALILILNCPGAVQGLNVQYSLLFDLDPTHRGLLRYTADGATSTHVLGPGNPGVSLEPGEANLWRAFADYLIEGVWHIWIGFDHILFLITLLLPAVLVYRSGRWQPADRFRPAIIDVLKIVTAFTVAHSVTLTLAVLEVVSLPARFVETAIAFSVLVTALNNLYPVFAGSRWLLAFGFGLIHGFGFANVLVDLGLARGALAASLFGFNLGVELGQAAIVAVFFPLAYLIRGSAFYRRAILGAGSVAAVGIAAVWMFERLAGYEILGL